MDYVHSIANKRYDFDSYLKFFQNFIKFITSMLATYDCTYHKRCYLIKFESHLLN